MNIDEETPESTIYSEILSELSQNPINLAKVDQEDWDDFFWLSENQKVAIQSALNENRFSYRNLPKEYFSKAEIRLLKKYTFYSVETPLKLSQRNRIYYQEKYKNSQSSVNLYQRIIANKSPFELCFLSQKDPTEKELTNFYSYFLSYQAHTWIEKIILGRYKLSFGQGLIMTSKLGLSKGSAVTSLPIKNRYSMKGYTSSYEIWFLQGGCAKMKFNNYDFIPFVSIADIPVSLEDNKITSFNETGLIDSDQLYTKEKIAGFHAHFIKNDLSLGSTCFYQAFSNPFADENLSNEFLAFSTDLQYRFKKIEWSSEIAFADRKTAFVSAWRWGRRDFRQLILIRHYSASFPTWHGKPFSSQSTFDNEDGIYFGWEMKIQKWKIRTYFDLWKFPETRYFEKMATTGNEEFIQMERKWKNHKLLVTINHKKKEKNKTVEDITKISPFQRTTFRFDWWQWKTFITFKNRIEYVCEHYSEQAETKLGFLCYQIVKLDFNRGQAVFQIAAYHSQVLHYMYEYSLNGMMQSAILSEDGIFCYLLLKYDLTPSTQIQTKISDQFNTTNSLELGMLIEYYF